MVLTVTGEMPEIEDPAVDVEVSMVEMAFNMPDTVPAGPGIWRVASDGALPHHMRIQAVDETVTVEQVMATINMFFEIQPPLPPTVPWLNRSSRIRLLAEDGWDTFSFDRGCQLDRIRPRARYLCRDVLFPIAGRSHAPRGSRYGEGLHRGVARAMRGH